MAEPTGRNNSPLAPLVWIDVETTGLHPEIHEILEIGMRATDGLLVPIDGIDDLTIVVNPAIKQDYSASLIPGREKTETFDLTKIDPVVVRMHAESGLLADVMENGISRVKTQEQIRNWLRHAQRVVYNTLPSEVTGDTFYSDCKFLMAGSTVGQFDRQFFSRLVGSLMMSEYFEYRVLDVSSIKELVMRLYGPEAKKPSPEHKAHRVIPDIQESIDELTFYIEHYFRLPAPIV